MWLLEVLQLQLLQFFYEAPTNIFLENIFIREAPKKESVFFY
jgi:hypothetical protein